jgi:hypothetical protein
MKTLDRIVRMGPGAARAGALLLVLGLAAPGPACAAEALLSPYDSRVAPGGTVRFQVMVDGGPPERPVAWRVVPPALGAVTEDGLFTAGPTPGRGIVRAEFPGALGPVVAHALVIVEPSGGPALGPRRVRVLPEQASLHPGEEHVFRAVPPEGDEDAAVTWSVEPADAGAIDASGLFRAGERPGAARVVARLDAGGEVLEGVARLRIGYRPAGAALDLRPRFITTEPGGEVPVDADLDGRAIPPDVPVRWSLIPPSLGTVTADGLFTASRAVATAAADDFGRREGVLVASALLPEGEVARATARVVIVPPLDRRQVAVFPSFATVAVDGQVAFRVAPIGAGTSDLAIEPRPRVTWLVRPDRLGAIGPDGVFAPNVRFALAAAVEGLREVEGRVLAEVRVSPGQVLVGEARLVLRLPDPALLQLVIEPNQVSLLEGANQRFVGFLGGRDVRELPLQASWSVSPQGLGTIGPDGLFVPAAGEFPAGTVRSGFVRLTVTSRTGTTREATSPVVITY